MWNPEAVDAAIHSLTDSLARMSFEDETLGDIDAEINEAASSVDVVGDTKKEYLKGCYEKHDVLLSPKLPLDAINLLKATTCRCLSKILYRRLKKDCFGCITNHPSQRNHACLYGYPSYYYEGFFDEICGVLLTKPFLKILIIVLELSLNIKASPEKIIGVAETVVAGLLPGTHIQEDITEILRQHINYTNESIIEKAVDLWEQTLPEP